MQVRFPGAAKDFSPRDNFQCRLSYGVRTPPCAVACIYICAHVKDPVVHVRVWWILETLKYPACTVGWEVQLCHSLLSPRKAPEFPMGEIPFGQYSCKRWKKNKSRCQLYSVKWVFLPSLEKCSSNLVYVDRCNKRHTQTGETGVVCTKRVNCKVWDRCF